MSGGDRVRFVLRGIGQTLITFGVVVLLFVVYEVWITNIFAGEAQARVAKAFDHSLESGTGSAELPLPGATTASIPLGSGIANIYIPRLGRDYHFTVVQGGNPPDQADLEKGPSHYGGTQLPGQVGNFAVAGHRVGKGEPFLNLNLLRPGDAVIVQTARAWYVYRVAGQRDDISAPGVDGFPGRIVVDPSDGNVLLPVPDRPDAVPTVAVMTLTTCTPKFTAAQRMVIFSVLASRVPVTATHGAAVLAMPSSITALFGQVG